MRIEIRDRRSERLSGRAAQRAPNHFWVVLLRRRPSVLWLLVTWWFGTMSWNWVTGLDAVVPPKQFSVLGFEYEIPQLAAT